MGKKKSGLPEWVKALAMLGEAILVFAVMVALWSWVVLSLTNC